MSMCVYGCTYLCLWCVCVRVCMCFVVVWVGVYIYVCASLIMLARPIFITCVWTEYSNYLGLRREYVSFFCCYANVEFAGAGQVVLGNEYWQLNAKMKLTFVNVILNHTAVIRSLSPFHVCPISMTFDIHSLFLFNYKLLGRTRICAQIYKLA